MGRSCYSCPTSFSINDTHRCFRFFDSPLSKLAYHQRQLSITTISSTSNIDRIWDILATMADMNRQPSSDSTIPDTSMPDTPSASQQTTRATSQSGDTPVTLAGSTLGAVSGPVIDMNDLSYMDNINWKNRSAHDAYQENTAKKDTRTLLDGWVENGVIRIQFVSNPLSLSISSR
jgi:hypothetical protein